MWQVVNQKNGISALGLSRILGLDYKTTWTLLHKLRRAMVRPGRSVLRGIVEVGECFIGGLEEGTPGRGSVDKVQVVIGVELKPMSIEGQFDLGRVRMKIIESA
jgi:hypothetical protein